MQFAEFAAHAREMEAEAGDIGTTLLVRDLLLAADGEGAAPGASGDDALPVLARFVQGRVFPAWRSETLDIGPSLCYEAIARAAGPNVAAADVEERLAETGEIGEVAASYEFGGQRGLGAFGSGSGGDDLTVREVDRSLRALAEAEGSGSEGRKLDALFGLFNRSTPDEARYLARLVLSEMRIGVGEGTVRDAIAEAFLVDDAGGAGGSGGADDAGGSADSADRGDAEDSDAEEDDTKDGDAEDGDAEADLALRASEDAVEAVERALQVSNDYGMVARVARDEGLPGLREVTLEVGRPVQAMLAQAGTVTDALAEWGTAAVETKYDGARVQVHYDGESASLFSRNMEDVTDPLPEIAEYVERELDAPAILDGEVVAVDDDGTPLPFQEVLRRFRRKHDVDRMREAVELRLHAFDCLHAAGEDLLDAALTERHDRLERLLPDDATADLLRTDDPDAIADFEGDALEAGHEGIMLKDPDSTYSPGKRGRNWLKRKPDVETLDLVVTGAEWGEGRRANHLGTFLLSARVDDGDGADDRNRGGASGGNGGAAYETLGKVATGVTDEELADLSERLEPHIVASDGREVDLRPEVVVEVGYEEIQRSPTYSSGYALRFPRFVGVREDKDPADADSLARVERLAESQ